MATAGDDGQGEETRGAERLERTIDRIAPLIAAADKALRGPVVEQTVTHTYQGAGVLLPAAVAVCFCALFFTLLSYLVVDKRIDREIGVLRDQRAEDVNTMRDQRAWIDLLRGKVAALEAKSKESK